MLTRNYTPDLEVRTTGDQRIIEGIVVPYNVRVHIRSEGIHESFAPGAFNHQLNAANRVKFSREHPTLGGQLIGRATELRDDAAGLFASFKVSKTDAGDETLELVRDGVLDEFSIGFRERTNRNLPDGTVQRTKADLIETSIVFAGAYGQDAVVTGTRRHEQSCLIERPNIAEAARILNSLQ